MTFWAEDLADERRKPRSLEIIDRIHAAADQLELPHVGCDARKHWARIYCLTQVDAQKWHKASDEVRIFVCPTTGPVTMLGSVKPTRDKAGLDDPMIRPFIVPTRAEPRRIQVLKAKTHMTKPNRVMKPTQSTSIRPIQSYSTSNKQVHDRFVDHRPYELYHHNYTPQVSTQVPKRETGRDEPTSGGWPKISTLLAGLGIIVGVVLLLRRCGSVPKPTSRSLTFSSKVAERDLITFWEEMYKMDF